MSVRDEHGLIGKALVIWLVILAILAVGILDFGSITATRFHIADLAAQAATDGANAFHDGGSSTTEKEACDATRTSLATADAAIKLVKCSLNTSTGELTITVRKVAHTIAASHIGFLKKFTDVEDTETAVPSTL
ncbi:MAG: hypothetical protein QOE25_450 [Actinomycetota bacterium]|jgi:hypothetical protein|nr:hypothetical protein [Actinomycetota bacterium]